MAQNRFSCYINQKDRDMLNKYMEEIKALDTNKEVEGAFRQAGMRIKSEAQSDLRVRLWQLKKGGSITRGLVRDINNKRYYEYTNGAERLPNTLNAVYSAKKGDIREYVGFAKKSYNGIGKLAHIFDQGTAERYTRKGYYRGHIFRKLPANIGANVWTPMVEQELPHLMNSIIIPAIERVINRTI